MSKKFAEHNGLNLTQTNNDVLQMWKEKNDGEGRLSAVCIL